MWNPFRHFKPRASLTERRWRRLARRTTRQTFLTWLAEQVAADLLDNKPFDVTIEELSLSVAQCGSSDVQHRAEHFIEKFYFDYPFQCSDRQCLDCLATFRQLIQQALLRLRPHDSATD